MYQRKTPLNLTCGIRVTMNSIVAKWKICIIYALRDTPKRPSELHRIMEKGTPRVINMQLKELESDGLVEKKVFAVTPPHSEYSITELGRSLLPIMDAMEEWGLKNCYRTDPLKRPKQ